MHCRPWPLNKLFKARSYLPVNLHGLTSPSPKVCLRFASLPPRRLELLNEITVRRVGKLLPDTSGGEVGSVGKGLLGIHRFMINLFILDEGTKSGRRFEVVIPPVRPHLRFLLGHCRCRLLPRRWWLCTAVTAPLGGQTDADPPGRRTAGAAGRLGHGAVL